MLTPAHTAPLDTLSISSLAPEEPVPAQQPQAKGDFPPVRFLQEMIGGNLQAGLGLLTSRVLECSL